MTCNQANRELNATPHPVLEYQIRKHRRTVLRARQLSRATMRNISRIFSSAFVYNALGVPIAAGVLLTHSSDYS